MEYMFLGFCYKGFHWPTLIVIMSEGKEDKMRKGGGGVAKKKLRGVWVGCCERNLRGGGMTYGRELKKTKRGGGAKKIEGGGG